MKIQSLVALVATIPVFWLLTSFVVPSDATAAYIPAISVVKRADPDAPRLGAVPPPLDEAP